MKYKKLVDDVKRDINSRLKVGSYCNNRVRYAKCPTWDNGNQINLWTYWQGYQLDDIDSKHVDILLVGQDWGNPYNDLSVCEHIEALQSGEKYSVYFGDKPGHTDKMLIDLFELLGCDIKKKNPGKRIFFTNYSLGYRAKDCSETGGMTKGLMKMDQLYFNELVEILCPKVIICLGKITFEMVSGNIAHGFVKQLKTGIPFYSQYNDNPNIHVYGVAHCGARGTSNVGGEENMKKAWAYISDAEKERI